jgi:hypothetical protein
MSSSAKCEGCGRALGHVRGCKYAVTTVGPLPAVAQQSVRDTVSFEAGRKAAFIAAVEECQAYSKSTTSEEAKAVAMNLAVRITQRAKRKS